MRRTISLALVLVLDMAIVFAFPTVAWPQTGEWTVYNTANSGLPFDGVNALAIDAQGTVWIGTGMWGALAGGGLARFDGENWTVYNTSNSELPNNDHNGLAIDAQGNIWCATEGGLAKFDGENWAVYTTHNSGLPHQQVHATPVFDAEGNAWIPTLGGLAKFDGENWTVYNTGNSGLPHNYVFALAFDAQENLWIGNAASTSGPCALAKFDGQNWMVYTAENYGLSGCVWDLRFDAQGNLWIGIVEEGTLGGDLAKFDGEDWTVYNTGNSGLPYDSVLALAFDPHGNLWVGTGDLRGDGRGLARFDGQQWTVYSRSNSGLPHNNVCSLAFDAQGNLWMGTRGGGLAVYRPVPVVDLNGDGIVDCADMCIMVEHWHTDEPSCDIGPTPFGDGIVDVRDLIVLAEHLFTYPGAVAYWRLDETEGDIAYDSVGDYDGTLIGGPVWQPTGGMVAGALQLDSIDDYVSTPFVLNPADGAFSVFAWIKGGAPEHVIISQTGLGGANWLCADAEGNLMTELKGSKRGATALLSETVIADGNWHRIGLVWDGSQRTLYVDDLEVAKDTQASLEGSAGGLHIGTGTALEAGSFFSGLIDDVRIYDRAVSP
jgi:sugar lactone lactonase YvrE